jgi:murein DD-endopeptidase MepM/ murein hydrolase activator NlpD
MKTKTLVALTLAALGSGCGGQPVDDSQEGFGAVGGVHFPGGPPIIQPSCQDSDLPLTDWPLDGVEGQAWATQNYVDDDSTSPGIKDWKGNTGNAARTYDGHRGIDIDSPDFRWMDQNLSEVHAVTAGTVIQVNDGNFDRNQIFGVVGCTAAVNQVILSHSNGYQSTYMHFKKNSITVKVGDVVQIGQVLGIAGSSGCSSNPHVHFELHDCSGNVIDTNARNMWTHPKAYAGPSGILDFVLSKSALSRNQIVDPQPNVVIYNRGETLNIGLSVATSPGETLLFQLLDPNGLPFGIWTWKQNAQKYQHDFLSWNWQLGQTTGLWTLQIFLDGVYKENLKLIVQ